MRYFSVECEAPGGGFGPKAQLKYDATNRYVQDVQYLDLVFEVWLGGELVQDVSCYCVSAPLWRFLDRSDVRGVSVRDMSVTAGDHVNDLHAGRIIPAFKELVLPRTARAQLLNGWALESKCIPDADMFTGPGLPLFVSDRGKELLVAYGVTGLEFVEAAVC